MFRWNREKNEQVISMNFGFIPEDPFKLLRSLSKSGRRRFRDRHHYRFSTIWNMSNEELKDVKPRVSIWKHGEEAYTIQVRVIEKNEANALLAAEIIYRNWYKNTETKEAFHTVKKEFVEIII